MAKDQIAKLSSRQYINIDFNENARRILIIGNTENMFGQYADLKEAKCCDIDTNNMAEEAYQALDYFIDRLENNTHIDIIGNNDTKQYYMRMFSYLIDFKIIKKNQYKSCIHFKEIKNDKEYLTFMDTVKNNGIKYDFIIQNPPYSGSFHLEFLKKGIELLKKNSGKMTIIEPATWLINLRKNGKASKYDEIKTMLKGHVSKVVIENMNIEFRTDQYMPFAITTIDFSKEYNNIEFNCFGEKKIANSLYDCNMIGKYNLIWSIFDKVQRYNDLMKDHIYNGIKTEGYWYCKFPQINSGSGSQLCAIFDAKRSDITQDIANAINWEDEKHNIIFENTGVKRYLQPFYSVCWHRFENKISDQPLKSYDKGKKLTDKDAACLTDTKEHLENWKHFVFNNKLPLFLNMCLTIDQHNNSLDFIPWLVDKQYTDEEINELFHFTSEEITLIDKTIKKFERNSPWFKRYMCGKDSVSDEEVQKFIDSL